MTEKEALELIEEKLRQATALIRECEQLAKENEVEFSWDGPSYGMGGRYYPNPDPDWVDSGCSDGDDEYGWSASSQSC